MDVASLFTKVKRSYNIQHDLKTQQSDIISQILEHRYVFGMLPTGYGKSACYIMPPLMFDEVGLV